MMGKTGFKSFNNILLKFLIVFIWISIIFLFLYSPLLKKDNSSINVFAWSGMYDLHYISKFEQETGIKVKFSYYESNEELLVKLRATKGYGYDLIIPGDYAVNILRKDHLLKKLDKSKLNFYDKLNPLLLGHYYDPKNKYSIPAEWAVIGLGIDKEAFKANNLTASWKLVFDPDFMTSKIVMSNDPLVSIPIAAFYLFGSIQNLTVDKLEKIKKLLVKQKKYVEAYADFRPDYFITTGNTNVAVSSSAYIWRAMFSNINNNIGFVIPKEGSLVTIENFAIPIRSKKENLVYKFLNFLMRPESTKHHFENENALFPVTTDVTDQLKLKSEVKFLLNIDKEEFEKFSFFKLDELIDPVNEKYLQDLWIKVKA